jgi:hypothetical protein
MQVFLSYTRNKNHFNKVSAFRERLYGELDVRAPGSRIFQDTNNLHDGAHFPEELGRELEASDVLLALVSPAWLQSEWCRREFSMFTNDATDTVRLHRILPVLWVDTPQLDLRSMDLIARTMAGISYSDWRDLRYESWDDPRNQRQIGILAKSALALCSNPSARTIEDLRLQTPRPTAAYPGTKGHAPTHSAHTLPTENPVVKHYSLVGFWDTLKLRHDAMCDARSLIASATERIFLSGITLNYIVQHCRRELESALRRGVLVEIVIAADTDKSKYVYKRYSSLVEDNLPLVHERFREFRQNQREDRVNLLSIYAAQIPLTHSLGLYDDRLFVSEFCIDTSSSESPSYELAHNADAYAILVAEIRVLLSTATPLYESRSSRILRTL